MRIRSIAVALSWPPLAGVLCVGAAAHLVPTGRVGDRALVVFAEPKEVAAFIRVTC